MRQYHRVANHYTSRSLKTPSLWDGSPFILTRVCRPTYWCSLCCSTESQSCQNSTFSGPSRKQRRTNSGQETLSLEGALPHGSEDVDTITFRFQSTRDIDVRITPLIAAAAARLEEDIATNVSTVVLVQIKVH